MSDVADSDSPQRTAEGRIQFEVSGTPGAPGPPRPFPAEQSNKISMGWEPPSDDGGSPITGYQVQELRTATSGSRAGPTSATSAGLENGRAYTFKVRAINKIGPGDWSDVSQSAYADASPGRVEHIQMKTRGDGTHHRRVGPAHDGDLEGPQLLRHLAR